MNRLDRNDAATRAAPDRDGCRLRQAAMPRVYDCANAVPAALRDPLSRPLPTERLPYWTPKATPSAGVAWWRCVESSRLCKSAAFTPSARMISCTTGSHSTSSNNGSGPA